MAKANGSIDLQINNCYRKHNSAKTSQNQLKLWVNLRPSDDARRQGTRVSLRLRDRLRRQHHPTEERVRAIGDHADLEDLYNTERHLLYVACTRARDRLLITGVDPASEFLEDLR